MHTTGSPHQSVLNRRTAVRSFLSGLAVSVLPGPSFAVAQPVTPATSPAPNLAQHFPDEFELPGGLELESAGAREEIGQIAGTFRNSRDAAQLLATWGWVGNAYRSYAAGAGAGTATPERVEISLHQFTSSTGAAYALSYFAHDRAVAFQHHEGLGELLLPCTAMVTGDGSATRFLRRGNLVVRVTVEMAGPMAADANTQALTSATDIALAVLANAGTPGPEGDTTC